jgi:hypothetical protein
MMNNSPKLHVHYVRKPSENALEHLRSLLSEAIILSLGSDLPDPAVYQILVDGVPKQEFIEEAHQLKSLIIPWAGLPASTR